MKKQQFFDPYWDYFLQGFLSGASVDLQKKEEFLALLNWDSQFREDFCDWLKCFREPSHSWIHNQKKERKSS